MQRCLLLAVCQSVSQSVSQQHGRGHLAATPPYALSPQRVWRHSLLVCGDECPLLLLSPGVLAYVGAQVVVPALPALLADAALARGLVEAGVELARDAAPVALAVLRDQAVGEAGW